MTTATSSAPMHGSMGYKAKQERALMRTMGMSSGNSSHQQQQQQRRHLYKVTFGSPFHLPIPTSSAADSEAILALLREHWAPLRSSSTSLASSITPTDSTITTSSQPKSSKKRARETSSIDLHEPSSLVAPPAKQVCIDKVPDETSSSSSASSSPDSAAAASRPTPITATEKCKIKSIDHTTTSAPHPSFPGITVGFNAVSRTLEQAVPSFHSKRTSRTKQKQKLHQQQQQPQSSTATTTTTASPFSLVLIARSASPLNILAHFPMLCYLTHTPLIGLHANLSTARIGQSALGISSTLCIAIHAGAHVDLVERLARFAVQPRAAWLPLPLSQPPVAAPSPAAAAAPSPTSSSTESTKNNKGALRVDYRPVCAKRVGENPVRAAKREAQMRELRAKQQQAQEQRRKEQLAQNQAIVSGNVSAMPKKLTPLQAAAQARARALAEQQKQQAATAAATETTSTTSSSSTSSSSTIVDSQAAAIVAPTTTDSTSAMQVETSTAAAAPNGSC